MEYDELTKFESAKNALEKEVSTAKQLADRISTAIPNLDFGSPQMEHLRTIQMPRLEAETLEQRNEYQSAAIFVESLANEALAWKKALEDGYAPSVIAFLYCGVEIQVESLSQVSFHGIRIEGKLNGAPCTMLAHQATVQILCYATEEIKEEPRRPIGFIWEGNEVKV